MAMVGADLAEEVVTGGIEHTADSIGKNAWSLWTNLHFKPDDEPAIVFAEK